MERRHGGMEEMDMTGMTGTDGHGADATAATGGSVMTMMAAVFQMERATPLYSLAWTPNNIGAYVATCVFLVVLAALLRALLALKAWKESRWLDKELNRRFVVVQGKLPLTEQVSRDSLSRKMTLTENGIEEDVVVVKKRQSHVRPWRFSVDPIRAVIDTIIAGVGYLLMLAVMTMNVGYFLSVLGGTFLGSLLVGRYALLLDH